MAKQNSAVTKQLVKAKLGAAPDFTDIELDTPEYKIAYINALNWLNSMYSVTELKQFAVQYAEQHGLEYDVLAKAHDSYFAVVGKLAWFVINDRKLAVESLAKLKEQLSDIIIETKRQHMLAYVDKIGNTRRDHKNLRKLHVIADLIDMIDASASNNEIYNVLVDNYTLALEIKERFDTELAALKHEDASEYYSSMEMQRLKDAYAYVSTSCSNLLDNKRATRKPRKRKATPATKKVANLQFKQTDDDYQLTSISPEDVVGVVALVAFNVKHRSLTVYIAKDGEVLDVNGTTIKNYDEEKSFGKTLRKPKEHLPALKRAHSVKRLMTIADNIRTKSCNPRSRTNKDTVLLKAITKRD